MLRFIPGSFVPRLTGLVFAIAILAALGVGVFSPGAAQAGPSQFERKSPEVVEWSVGTQHFCTSHTSTIQVGTTIYTSTFTICI